MGKKGLEQWEIKGLRGPMSDPGLEGLAKKTRTLD